MLWGFVWTVNTFPQAKNLFLIIPSQQRNQSFMAHAFITDSEPDLKSCLDCTQSYGVPKLSSLAPGVTKMFTDAIRGWSTLILKVWTSHEHWVFGCSTFNMNSNFLLWWVIFFRMFSCISETHITMKFLLWASESQTHRSLVFSLGTLEAPVTQALPERNEVTFQPKVIRTYFIDYN